MNDDELDALLRRSLHEHAAAAPPDRLLAGRVVALGRRRRLFTRVVGACLAILLAIGAIALALQFFTPRGVAIAPPTQTMNAPVPLAPSTATSVPVVPPAPAPSSVPSPAPSASPPVPSVPLVPIPRATASP